MEALRDAIVGSDVYWKGLTHYDTLTYYYSTLSVSDPLS